jgi:type I restriction enzyme S subunit
MKWEKVKIEEIGEVTSGGTPFTGNPGFWNGDIGWITPKDLSNYEFRFISNGERNITEEGLKNSSARIVKAGSILLSSRAPIGYLAIAEKDLTTNQGFKNITPNTDYDNMFLFYCLKNNIEYLKSLGIGATYPELSSSRLKEVELLIPPLPTQRKIASILSAYDDLIENNLKRIKLLEEMAKLHYKELMQEINYTKTKREEYIKDCLAFYIGGGWGEEDYKEGFTEPAFVIRGTDIPDVKKGDIKNVPLRYHKESNLASRSMQTGDIVFEVSGGSKGQPVGRSILITEKMLQQFGKPVMCASFCKMLRPNENVTPEFLYLYLLSSYENGVIAQYEKHSASNIINYGFEEFIGEQKITIPKESELKAFTEKVKPIFTLISTLGEQNAKLREARDILLPKLMNGQIEV